MINLSGVWITKGNACGQYRTTEVSVTLAGKKLIATKITGDDCVPAGSKTFSGNVPSSTDAGQSFPITWVIGTPEQPASSTASGILTVVDDNRFTISGQFSATFSRFKVVSNGRNTTGTRNADTINGSSRNDTLNSAGGSDSIRGGDGNDGLNGGSGDDLLDGGNGKDFLYGGAGQDVLSGGMGNDVLVGGTGSDVFVLGKGEGFDEIYGFKQGEDGLGFNGFEKIEYFRYGKGRTKQTIIEGDGVPIAIVYDVHLF